MKRKISDFISFREIVNICQTSTIRKIVIYESEYNFCKNTGPSLTTIQNATILILYFNGSDLQSY